MTRRRRDGRELAWPDLRKPLVRLRAYASTEYAVHCEPCGLVRVVARYAHALEIYQRHAHAGSHAVRTLPPEQPTPTTQLRFFAFTTDEARAEFRGQLAALTPTRKPGRPRRWTLAQAGAAVLDAPPAPAPARPWAVSIPYTSQADEPLVTIFAGLTQPAAEALASRHQGRAWSAPFGVPLDDAAPGFPSRRVVRFPSELALAPTPAPDGADSPVE